MWILKLHIAISILSWLSMDCMRIIFKESYRRYLTERSKRKHISIERIAIYVCPILNIVMPICMFRMAVAPDDYAKKIKSELNENVEVGD